MDAIISGILPVIIKYSPIRRIVSGHLVRGNEVCKGETRLIQPMNRLVTMCDGAVSDSKERRCVPTGTYRPCGTILLQKKIHS